MASMLPMKTKPIPALVAKLRATMTARRSARASRARLVANIGLPPRQRWEDLDRLQSRIVKMTREITRTERAIIAALLAAPVAGKATAKRRMA